MVSWPYEFDTLTNPVAADKTNSSSVPHALQHANLNDIVEALQLKQGRSSTAISGSSAASTGIGDVFHVGDTAGRTKWGPKASICLADTLLASTSTVITLSAIPQTYRHLHLEVNARNDTTGTAISSLAVQFNGDTSTNYWLELLIANGSSVFAIQGAKSTSIGLGGTMNGGSPAGRMALNSFTIPNYASSQQLKNIRGVTACVEGDGSSGGSTNKTFTAGGMWQSTAPITSITLLPGASGFAAPTRVTLTADPSTV